MGPEQGSAAQQPQQYPLPGCYRHPERATGVRCTRCGRPICPECMVNASVGFQCPECVREGASSVRAARTEAGGRVVARGGLVTSVLIAVNVVVWLLAYTRGVAFVDRLVLVGEFPYPAQPGSYGVATGQWYRLLTAVFLHQSWLHIGMNMLALYSIGPQLEHALGRLRYLALYLVSGLAGTGLSYLVAAPQQASLGASGAIFGLLGATLVYYRKRGFELGPIVSVIVFNLILTFSVPLIDWRAHVGGLVAGGLLMTAMMHGGRKYRAPVQVGAVVVVLCVVAAMVWVRTGQITG
jgi:membrane associated rhomboid family serine protease